MGSEEEEEEGKQEAEAARTIENEIDSQCLPFANDDTKPTEDLDPIGSSMMQRGRWDKKRRPTCSMSGTRAHD